MSRGERVLRLGELSKDGPSLPLRVPTDANPTSQHPTPPSGIGQRGGLDSVGVGGRGRLTTEGIENEDFLREQQLWREVSAGRGKERGVASMQLGGGVLLLYRDERRSHTTFGLQRGIELPSSVVHTIVHSCAGEEYSCF